MKKIWAGMKTALCICGVLGWWGVLYPELVLTADTYRICNENGQEEQDLPADEDVYWNLLKADRSEIRFRSRLLVEWNKFMEALHESDQNGTAP